MLKSFLSKTTGVVWRRPHARRKPHLDAGFLELLDTLVEWKVNARLCQREDEENAALAKVFADGPANKAKQME